MTNLTFKFPSLVSTGLLILSTAAIAACGGSQEPAASAEEASTTEPEAEPAAEGEGHTMPDGTKMPGKEHHEEGSSGGHTMPDGTEMP